ncbi:MAG: helix-turn-helix domain-containing protein [Elusimicrobia bacterium]|nr:helix-turn-helix domain-containing protein [Elusimicrobiota bacterium]MDE2424559.1 helix-turn-helix domain-containing protein [Elusimicrobiota bacterium]
MKKRRKAARKPFLGEVPEVMDIKALAQYLGMGRSKIYGLIRQKKVPASRIGRQYRFSKTLVDAWLKERLIMPAPEPQFPLFPQKPGR